MVLSPVAINWVKWTLPTFLSSSYMYLSTYKYTSTTTLYFPRASRSNIPPDSHGSCWRSAICLEIKGLSLEMRETLKRVKTLFTQNYKQSKTKFDHNYKNILHMFYFHKYHRRTIYLRHHLLLSLSLLHVLLPLPFHTRPATWFLWVLILFVICQPSDHMWLYCHW